MNTELEKLNEQRLMVPLELIDPDPDNANDHDLVSIEAIRASYEKFGQQKPIVVRIVGDRLRCVDGSGQRLAAEQLNWPELWVTITDLDELDATAYGVAANETARHSRMNDQRLAGLLSRLHEARFPTEYLGIPDERLKGLIAQATAAEPHQASTRQPGQESSRAPAEGDSAKKARPIIVTPNQRQIIEGAIEQVRMDENNPEMAEGRAIELICADFLSGRIMEPKLVKSPEE